MYLNDNKKPFVGLIVGPYSPNVNQSCLSDVWAFYIVESAFKKPYEILINVIPQGNIDEEVYELML